MNLTNIFESTDFVHASGTKEELQVAEFLKGQCEELGVTAKIEAFRVAIFLQMGKKFPVRHLTVAAVAL